MENNVAIITARGGSKRIPKKNVKSFLGQPIIKYSIDAALECGLFKEVMVSTDDQNIADMSIKLGASVPFLRTRKNSDDYSSTADVLIEVLQKYLSEGEMFDITCCIYPTAPFITAEKLINSYQILMQSGADSVIPVASFNYPIQRALVIKKNKLQWLYPENEKKRSQDLIQTYHDAGQFYWLKVEQFLKRGKIISENTLPYIISELEMQDIDNEEDWQVAEVKYMHWMRIS